MQDDLFGRRDHTTQVEGKCSNILTYSPKKILENNKSNKKIEHEDLDPLVSSKCQWACIQGLL